MPRHEGQLLQVPCMSSASIKQNGESSYGRGAREVSEASDLVLVEEAGRMRTVEPSIVARASFGVFPRPRVGLTRTGPPPL